MAKEMKQQAVENHLNQLMESDDFTIDDLLGLTVEDLAQVPQLKEIGKITISSVLSSYKSKYEEDFFNDIDSEVLAEIGEPLVDHRVGNNDSQVFDQDEIQALKKMVLERGDQQNSELIELKLALKNAGIDYVMILKDYRAQKESELLEWEASINR